MIPEGLHRLNYSIDSTALPPISEIGREPFVLSIINSIVAEFSE